MQSRWPGEFEESELFESENPQPLRRLADMWGRVTDAFRIQDRTNLTPKEQRKGTRAPGKVYALVLHQMAFSRGSDSTRYDRVTAHFAILPDGKILQLHPVSALLWASNGFNAGSVAVEFAGNFPNVKGRCWAADRFGCHRVTDEQIMAGRYLVDHLIRTIGLTHVLAHRQSSGTRENDPGPDIWYHVGQWAVQTRGLRDGGPGFKVGTGNPIPEMWRVWGQPGQPGHRGLSFEISEMEGEYELLRAGDQMHEPWYGAHELSETSPRAHGGSGTTGRWVRNADRLVLFDT